MVEKRKAEKRENEWKKDKKSGKKRKKEISEKGEMSETREKRTEGKTIAPAKHPGGHIVLKCEVAKITIGSVRNSKAKARVSGELRRNVTQEPIDSAQHSDGNVALTCKVVGNN